MSDQVTTTPGLRDVIAQDAQRLEGEPDAWQTSLDTASDRRRAAIARWLRSEAARAVVARCVGDHFGFCDGHQRPYADMAAHLAEELARAVERG